MMPKVTGRSDRLDDGDGLVVIVHGADYGSIYVHRSWRIHFHPELWDRHRNIRSAVPQCHRLVIAKSFSVQSYLAK